ncbi:integrase core domain-containing protein, partial [Rhodobacteraceae bacterium NNCM2]|nr:integrase core domain-containing protein [Coraliihabitans acroporae]
QRLIEAWRRDYNECRPHMAYNCRTPMEFAESSGMCHACSMKPPLDSNLSHGPPNPSVSSRWLRHAETGSNSSNSTPILVLII